MSAQLSASARSSDGLAIDLFRVLDHLGRADVEPASFQRQAEQAAALCGGEKEWREAEGLQRAAFEQCGFDDADAGIDIGRRFARRGPRQAPVGVAEEIAPPLD